MSNPVATEAMDSLKTILNELLVKDIKAISENSVKEVKTGTSTLLNNWLHDQFDQKQRDVYNELQKPRFDNLEDAERDLITKTHTAVQELITIREAVTNRFEVFIGEILSAFDTHKVAIKSIGDNSLTGIESVKNELIEHRNHQERVINELQETFKRENKALYEKINQYQNQTRKVIHLLIGLTSVSFLTSLGILLKVLLF